jgi:hypothetical protein
VLDIDIERLALQKQLQIPVQLQCGVRRDLVEHLLERGPSRLDKIALKPAHGLLLGRRRHHHAGVVAVQGIVQPEKVAIPPLDLELGLLVCLRRRLPPSQHPSRNR